MMRATPVTLAQAKAFVGEIHRHHDAPVGHKWSIACESADGILRGVAVVSRPVGRNTRDKQIIVEVTRLCTDGHKNACSFLYSKAARIAREMGYWKIQTFLLKHESGVSLKAAGWQFDGMTKSDTASWKNRSGRIDQPIEQRQRWVKVLNSC